MFLKQNTLYLICGPSGSGKSTRAKNLMRSKNIKYHFEADMWMIDNKGNYKYDTQKLNYCHKVCQTWTEIIMRAQKDVIVSNTNLTKKDAAPYIRLAKLYNYNVIIEHLTNKFLNEHGVPDWKIKQMHLKQQFFTLNDFM
jgi:predicted kinase